MVLSRRRKQLILNAKYVALVPTNQGVVGSNPAGRASNIKELGQRPNSFFLVRPAGRTYLEVEVLYTPGKGKC